MRQLAASTSRLFPTALVFGLFVIFYRHLPGWCQWRVAIGFALVFMLHVTSLTIVRKAQLRKLLTPVRAGQAATESALQRWKAVDGSSGQSARTRALDELVAASNAAAESVKPMAELGQRWLDTINTRNDWGRNARWLIGYVLAVGLVALVPWENHPDWSIWVAGAQVNFFAIVLISGRRMMARLRSGGAVAGRDPDPA